LTIPPYLYILILKRFNVEADGRNRLDGFVAFILEPVQDRRFPGVVQTQDQDPHFLRAEEALEELAEHDPHLCACEFALRPTDRNNGNQHDVKATTRSAERDNRTG